MGLGELDFWWGESERGGEGGEWGVLVGALLRGGGGREERGGALSFFILGGGWRRLRGEWGGLALVFEGEELWACFFRGHSLVSFSVSLLLGWWFGLGRRRGGSGGGTGGLVAVFLGGEGV